MMKRKIVLAGGTGNLGKSLSFFLKALGYEIIVFSRSETKSTDGISYVRWDGKTVGAWRSSLAGVEAVINLSGKSVQCRFTEANKRELLRSRIEPTKAIGEAIATLDHPPKLWINFSGISIFEGEESLNDENSTSYGSSFLANLSKQWEETFFSSQTSVTTKVCLRISPVLSTQYGMFKELYPLTKLGMGGQVGNGKQMVSWIHEMDLLRMVEWILTKEQPSAVYHACVPKPSSNADFMKALRKSIGISFGLPLPRALAHIGSFVKGVESSMLLNTNAVGTTRTTEEGFTFLYPETLIAFKQLIK